MRPDRILYLILHIRYTSFSVYGVVFRTPLSFLEVGLAWVVVNSFFAVCNVERKWAVRCGGDRNAVLTIVVIWTWYIVQYSAIKMDQIKVEDNKPNSIIHEPLDVKREILKRSHSFQNLRAIRVFSTWCYSTPVCTLSLRIVIGNLILMLVWSSPVGLYDRHFDPLVPFYYVDTVYSI